MVRGDHDQGGGGVAAAGGAGTYIWPSRSTKSAANAALCTHSAAGPVTFLPVPIPRVTEMDAVRGRDDFNPANEEIQ